MSRFEDLVSLLVPQMRIRAHISRVTYEGYRKRFALWSNHRQAQHPEHTVVDRIGEHSDLETVWSVFAVSLLWQDRFLAIPFDSNRYTPLACEWYETTETELLERAQAPASLMKYLHVHFWSLSTVDGVAQRPHEEQSISRYTRRGSSEEQLWERYQQTKRFFGRVFRPLMEAYKLGEEGERETPLYALMQPGGTCTIAVSEVNRLVITHLGLSHFHALVGRKRSSQAQERVVVDLCAYSDQEQAQVAASLMQQRSMRLDARLALSELALRQIIPTGIYLLRDDTVDAIR